MPSAAELIASLLCAIESRNASKDNVNRLLEFSNSYEEHASLRHALQQASTGPLRSDTARAIADAGRRLAALSSRLLGDWRAGQARRLTALPRLLAALHLTACCAAALHSVHATDGAAVEAMLSCAALALGPGAAVLSTLVTGRQLFPGGAAGMEPALLSAQTYLVYCLQLVAVARGSMSSFVRHAPPGQLLAWLEAAVSAARVLHGPMLNRCAQPGSSVQLVHNLCSLTHAICSEPALKQHAAALKEALGTQETLLHKLLLPVLHTSAIAAQLPPDRQPTSFSWGNVFDVALPTLKIDAQAQPAAADSALRLLQSASALLAHMPAEPPEGRPAAFYNVVLLTLLARACRRLQSDRETLHRTAHSLLPAIQRLPALLELLSAGSLTAVQRAASCDALAAVAGILLLAFDLKAVLPQTHLQAVQELPAWCAAAGAMLRALPHAVALGDDAPDGSYMLLSAAAAIASAFEAVAREACAMEGGSGPLEPSMLPAASNAADALWSLHTTCCRLVHCPSADGPAAEIMHQCSWKVAELLANAMSAVCSLSTCFDAAAAADDAHAQAMDRRLGAMGAAHCEALFAMFHGSGLAHVQLQPQQLPPGSAAIAARSLLDACSIVAAPLLLSEPLQALLSGLLERMQPEESDESFSAIQVTFGCSPPLLAFLAARSLLAIDVLLMERLARAGRIDAGRSVAVDISSAFASLSRGASDALRAAEAAGVGDVAAELRQAVQTFDAAASRVLRLFEATLPLLELAAALRRDMLAPARTVGAALWAWHQQPEQQAAHRLELARVAAGRSCSYLRCANLAGEGGPAAGEGAGSSKCSVCREAWYCDEACSNANWRAGGQHRRVCKILAAEHAAQRAARRAAASGSGP